MTESQISEEVANAQRDIEARLNSLENRIGRPVVDVEFIRVECTSMAEAHRRWVRLIRVVPGPALGQIGQAGKA